MLASHAFKPLQLSTQRVSVGATVATVTLADSALDLAVWIDNRGSTDVLVEVGSTNPTDTTSFPIPAMTSQPIGMGQERELRLKRPAGSTAAEVIVTPGEGM